MKSATTIDRTDMQQKPVLMIEKSTTATERDLAGIVKLPHTAPPNEELVQRLNELAARFPFNMPHKARKHDTL